MAAPISTTYSDEAKQQVIDHVIDQIASGRALSKILREDDFMPSVSGFYKWLDADPALVEKVERAREIGAATILEEIVDIADESGADVYIDHRKDGTPFAKIDGEAIQRSKLRVYAREKYAQMIAPRRFGPKVDVTSGGEALPAPQATSSKIEALIAIGVQRVLEKREMKQLPRGEEDGDT